MKVQVTFNIYGEEIKDFLRLYLGQTDSPTKKDFKEYVKIQLNMFGTDAQFGENWEEDRKNYPDPEKYYKKWFGKN